MSQARQVIERNWIMITVTLRLLEIIALVATHVSRKEERLSLSQQAGMIHQGGLKGYLSNKTDSAWKKVIKKRCKHRVWQRRCRQIVQTGGALSQNKRK